ncbi:LysR substrate-binding domain-containing protein [Pseudophaeobacter sp.]|uniref:LysR substrate-binding domain-containing protein n=1 Tax=Pseudophaeobacter sp. TaxID=1971739 RepID=UPI0040587A5C
MRFTLKQLKYFDAALRTGSIARAAVEMNISQSSITAAIDIIEQTTQAELLRRLPAKGIIPTKAGLAVGARVQEFLEQARIFESDLLSLTGDPAGSLRLGCYAPTAPYVLPPLLKRISQKYPSISIELKEGDMQSITDLLNSGAVDLALTYRRETPGSQPFIPMFRASPIALIPDVSPLAQQQEVQLQELAELPMILLDLPGTRPYFNGLFSSQGLRPNIAHTTKSSSVLRGLVAANFGYALMNICGPQDRTGQNGYVARPIVEDLDSPQYGVAYTHASQRSTLVKTILETCREVAEEGKFRDLLFTVEGARERPPHLFT